MARDPTRSSNLLRSGVSEGVLRGFEKDPYQSHGFMDNIHKGIAAGRASGGFQKPFYQARVIQISPDTSLPMNSAYGHLIGYLHAFYGGTSNDIQYRGGDFLLVYGEVIEREGRMGMLEINSSNDYARLESYPLFVGSQGGAYPTLGDLMEVMYYDPDNPLKGGIILRHLPIFNVPYGPPPGPPGGGPPAPPAPPAPTPPPGGGSPPPGGGPPPPGGPPAGGGPVPIPPALSKPPSKPKVDIKLHGYRFENLNPKTDTKTGPGVIHLEHVANVIQTLNCLEVLHAYLSQDSAGNVGANEVVIKPSQQGGYDHSTKRDHGQAWKNHVNPKHSQYGKGKGIAHPLGTALDLAKVVVGGKALTKYQIYMAWVNLVKAKKVPDGGLGFYFKKGLGKASSHPHYDHWGPNTSGFSGARKRPAKWIWESGKSINKKYGGAGWKERKKKARAIIRSKGKKGLPSMGPNVPDVTDIPGLRAEQKTIITTVAISGLQVATLLAVPSTQKLTAEQFIKLAHQKGSVGALY